MDKPLLPELKTTQALSLAEAAAFLKRKNVEYFRRNLKKWGVPHRQVGRHYVFTEAALLAYLNTRQASGKEESCPTGGKEVVTGISTSKEYAALLGLNDTKTPKHSKTS